MELSEEIQSILQKYKVSPGQAEKCDRTAMTQDLDREACLEDLIDVDEIDMFDDQTWLMETEDSTIQNLTIWLYDDLKVLSCRPTMLHDKRSLGTKKNIDSRTFTRPKKKLNRPSIEKYNEDYFDVDRKSVTALTEEIDNYMSDMYGSFPEDKALQFDLSQPTSGNFFDKILSGASDLDSFQNMSPPSLVNSMCSSTFMNLMENSFIKNDPVLREIRDADYSQEIYQDSEPPLFQSFTESCTSINSDVAESFVRRTLNALNGTPNLNASSDESYKTPPTTIIDPESYIDNKGDSFTLSHDNHTENIDPNIPLNNTHTPSFNGTFRKDTSAKLKASFIKDKLNSTFNKEPDVEADKDSLTDFERKSLRIKQNLSNTFTEISRKEQEQLNNLEQSPKYTTSVNLNGFVPEEKADLNGTYLKEQNNLNNTFRKSADCNDLNNTYEKSGSKFQSKLKDALASECRGETEGSGRVANMRRLSVEIDEFLSEKMNDVQERDRNSCNTSVRLSADSTDSLDRMSSLSNSSRDSRHISMAEVDAIVEQQERSLQVMSTPKPARSLTRLFENTCLSPIPNLNIKEHLSDSEISSEEYVSVRSGASTKHERANLDRNVKSLSNLKNPTEVSKPRSINTMASNLNTASRLKGSYGSLQAASAKLRGSYGNLGAIKPVLKGSYTSLQPFNSNLPNIPPKGGNVKATSKITHTLEEPRRGEVFKVPPARRDYPDTDGTFVKPQSKLSSLPRPVSSATGIPRPMSKIPGPKTVRSVSASSRQLVRPSSKPNVNDGFY